MRTSRTMRSLGAELLRPDAPLDRVVRQAGPRADREDPAEIRAETFGPHLGMLLKAFLPPTRQEQFPEEIERINTSLEWAR